MQMSPEIRIRIDCHEREQFERVAWQLGTDMNEVVGVFIRCSIAVGGFPFAMRVPLVERTLEPRLLRVADEIAPVAGFSMRNLNEISRRAFDAAYEEHV